MTIQLDRMNPKFRQLVDLFFFSDKMDFDVSEFKLLLKEKNFNHLEYMWDRLQKCTSIFWENGAQFWKHRFSFLFSLNEKSILQKLELYLERRMFNLVIGKSNINIIHDIEYLQYVEFFKQKHFNGNSIENVANYILSLPSNTSMTNLLSIVNSFTPFLFKDLNDFANKLIKKITQSCRNFDFLLSLEEIAPQDFCLNRNFLTDLAIDIINERAHNGKNHRIFFRLINDDRILYLFKIKYNSSLKLKLVEFLKSCDYQMIEDFHLRNIRNLLNIDSSLSENIIEIYGEKIYNRKSGHRRANTNKLIKLVKTFSQISSRQILFFLSSHNEINDIKYVLLAFPHLNKLAVFV